MAAQPARALFCGHAEASICDHEMKWTVARWTSECARYGMR